VITLFKIIRNGELYAPENLGKNDILIAGEKIALVKKDIGKITGSRCHRLFCGPRFHRPACSHSRRRRWRRTRNQNSRNKYQQPDNSRYNHSCGTLRSWRDYQKFGRTAGKSSCPGTGRNLSIHFYRCLWNPNPHTYRFCEVRPGPDW